MKELTGEQNRAAEAVGSVAVTAGAGTGKTSMLAARFLHHVRQDGLSPLSIVAVTFTEKASAELRSRIRKTLKSETQDEQIVAEVEAAQISTMHSLASRICRDFYDLAGIPADFTILDDVDSPLWTAEKFDEAVGGIDRSIVEELGFNWLTTALKVLLKDPYASEKALAVGSRNWRGAIGAASASAVEKLVNSPAWNEASAVLRDCRGTPRDKLEAKRAETIAALSSLKDSTGVVKLNAVLKNFRSNSGAAAKWDAGDLDSVRGCLISLKEAVKRAFDLATLTFGPEDEKAARLVGPLATAFRQVTDQIAAEKLREKVLDFGDLEQYALKILESTEAIDHYKARWRAFLVDEFQDTNPIQAEILSRLSRGAALTVVGDEKQAIYGFRGADIGVFGRVRTEITERGGGAVPLSKTFRSHHDLVMTMNAIFAPVLGTLHQPLEADRSISSISEPFVQTAIVEKVDGTAKEQLEIIEARYIADQIAKLHDGGVAYKDIAILSRVWAPLDVYLDVLSAMGIPAVHAGGGSLLETREAADICALLSFLSEPTDDVPLVAVLRSPFFAISDRVLFEAATALSADVCWWEVIQQRREFEHPVSVLRELLASRDASSSDQIVALADRLTGYGAVIANLPHGSRRVADLGGLREFFRRLERNGRGDVFGTTRYLRELITTETAIPRPPLDAGEAVSLMTIHKAKGLEWPVVFVPDLARQMQGNHAAILIDNELGVAFQMDGEAFEKDQPAIHKLIKLRIKERENDEARRLLYVAVTRAKDKVFLTATKAKGPYIDILRPGLDAAGMIDEIIPYNDTLAIAPSPGEPAPFALPEHFNIEAVTVGLDELPVTALTAYARCPKRFEYQYVAGHPGLGEGAASAMAIGSLAHLALELDIGDVETLRKAVPDSTDEQLEAALGYANAFRTNPAYEKVRLSECQKEVRFAIRSDGLTLSGIADLVGPDFVLDYKTDAEMHPDEHRFQLWAYAAAFSKPRALIAYLRWDTLHEWPADSLAQIGVEASALIRRIRQADYAATPSFSECSACPFEKICESSSMA